MSSKRSALKKAGGDLPVIHEPKGQDKVEDSTEAKRQQSLIAEKKKNITERNKTAVKRVVKDASRSANGISPDVNGDRIKDGVGHVTSSGAKKDSLGKPAKICRLM